MDKNDDKIFSRNLVCVHCNISYQEMAPNSFSFNSPFGSCPDCDGLGEKKEFDIELVIPDWNKSINEEGIAAIGKPRKIWFFNQLEAVAEKYNFTYDTKLIELSEDQKNILLYGSKDKIPFQYKFGGGKTVNYMHKFSGIINYVKHYYENTGSSKIRDWAEAFMNTQTCSSCNGGRLKKESLSVTFQEKILAK